MTKSTRSNPPFLPLISFRRKLIRGRSIVINISAGLVELALRRSESSPMSTSSVFSTTVPPLTSLLASLGDHMGKPREVSSRVSPDKSSQFWCHVRSLASTPREFAVSIRYVVVRCEGADYSSTNSRCEDGTNTKLAKQLIPPCQASEVRARWHNKSQFILTSGVSCFIRCPSVVGHAKTPLTEVNNIDAGNVLSILTWTHLGRRMDPCSDYILWP